MNEKFLNLKSEKRNRILQAAYEEFTEHSYNDASTNRIVKKAGISKGTLFNYFGSKEELCHYLVDYGLNFMQENYIKNVEYSTGDFIERYKLMAELDMKAYAEVPYMIDFLTKFYIKDESVELPPEVEEKRNHAIQVIQVVYQKLYNNLDYSLFRDDVPAEQIVKMIRWIFEGYEKEIFVQLNETELSYESLLSLVGEFENHLEVLKKIFYK